MQNAQKSVKLLGPILTVIAITVTALVGALWVICQEIDHVSRAREEALVKSQLAHKAEDTARMMVPLTVWDEAARRVNQTFDEQWLSDNIIYYVNSFLEFDRSYVYDFKGKIVHKSGQDPVLEMHERSPVSVNANSAISTLKSDYLSARALGRDAWQFKNAQGLYGVQNGVLYFLGASMILPGAESKLFDYSPHTIVGVHRVNQQELDEISEHSQVGKMSVTASLSKALPDDAHIEFNDAASGQKAYIYWSPQRPGEKLFLSSLGPLLFMIVIISGITLLMIYRTQSIARELVASEAKAKHMATHDALTDLPNRYLIGDRFAQAQERSRRHGGDLALMCIGVDKIKDVNDTLGHAAGDELLVLLAKLLSGLTRASDTLGRAGGDEFIIVQNDVDGMGAKQLAERILAAVNGTIELAAGQVYNSCSVGITLVRSGDTDASEAFRQADMALDRAKAAGRGHYVFFEPEMDASIKLRKTLEQGLRDAIHDQTLNVFYQPQVNIHGRMVGVEALCRWTHPERGPVSPAYFIPLAESCGLMESLGLMVLRRAATDAKRWPGLKVAVNVSAAQLKADNFVQQVGETLKDAGVRPEQIEIELTEGMLLGDDPQTHSILNQLREMGLSIALDDFGTGYSSLSYLNRYPINKIKIDRSFVTKVGMDSEADAVMKAIVRLSQALNLNIVAEGVENRLQRNLLKKAGCHIFQGYAFSKAVGADAIDRMVSLGGQLELRDETPKAA